MIKKLTKMIAMAAAIITVAATGGIAQDYDKESRYDYMNAPKEIRIDRYLDVEIWTNHNDNEFFEGDNVEIKYRANHDAFVAIYSVDSKGRVNLLFPTEPQEDNFIRGGVTYRIPDGYDDYDLVVSGPDGIETIQIIASRERFPIPDWYNGSSLMFDWDDRHEFMDYVNRRYFVRYNGQKFAFDRQTIYVNEWEPTYFRPIYYPNYPSWTLSGNVYIDYPWGSTVYINGIYWGIAPLYIPRIYVGWHTITIYDHYGYGWESDIHITRYHTVILDRDIIVTRPGLFSKYKEVREIGYRDPVNHGYPGYKRQVTTMKSVVENKVNINNKATVIDKNAGFDKKYLRGSSKLVKTDRGYETTGLSTEHSKYDKLKYESSKKSSSYNKSDSRSTSGKYSREYKNTDSEKQSSRSSTKYGSDSKSSIGSKSSTYESSKSSQSSKGSKVTEPKKSKSSGKNKSGNAAKVKEPDQKESNASEKSNKESNQTSSESSGKTKSSKKDKKP